MNTSRIFKAAPRYILRYISIFLCAFPTWAVAGEATYVPKQGFVPDQTTAVRIAEAVLVPIYGDQILKQRPFNANLSGDRWIIEGSFSHPKGEGWRGGVALIEIKKSSGEILKVTHGK
jgi:hypothetical protein